MEAIRNVFNLSPEDCARLIKCHPKTIEKLKNGEINLPEILPEIRRRMSKRFAASLKDGPSGYGQAPQ